MEILKLTICAGLARMRNKEVNLNDIEIESFWFEPEGTWRAVVVYNRGIVRVCGSVSELFGGGVGPTVVADEEPAEADVEPGADGRIEVPITGKGYGIGPHCKTYNVQTHVGELEISEMYLHHKLGPAFSEVFGDADCMEITFRNKYGRWAPKKA